MSNNIFDNPLQNACSVMNKIVVRHNFLYGDYITTPYYESLINAGFKAYVSGVEYKLYNHKNEVVHTHLNCKDGYKLFLKTIPQNLI